MALNPDGVIALLGRILHSTPSLPGAACRGRHDLFDDQPRGESVEDRRYRLDAALRVCRGCPVQGPCAATLPRRPEPGRGGVAVQGGRLLVEPVRGAGRSAVA